MLREARPALYEFRCNVRDCTAVDHKEADGRPPQGWVSLRLDEWSNVHVCGEHAAPFVAWFGSLSWRNSEGAIVPLRAVIEHDVNVK